MFILKNICIPFIIFIFLLTFTTAYGIEEKNETIISNPAEWQSIQESSKAQVDELQQDLNKCENDNKSLPSAYQTRKNEYLATLATLINEIRALLNSDKIELRETKEGRSYRSTTPAITDETTDKNIKNINNRIKKIEMKRKQAEFIKQKLKESGYCSLEKTEEAQTAAPTPVAIAAPVLAPVPVPASHVIPFTNPSVITAPLRPAARENCEVATTDAATALCDGTWPVYYYVSDNKKLGEYSPVLGDIERIKMVIIRSGNELQPFVDQATNEIDGELKKAGSAPQRKTILLMMLGETYEVAMQKTEDAAKKEELRIKAVEHYNKAKIANNDSDKCLSKIINARLGELGKDTKAEKEKAEKEKAEKEKARAAAEKAAAEKAAADKLAADKVAADKLAADKADADKAAADKAAADKAAADKVAADKAAADKAAADKAKAEKAAAEKAAAEKAAAEKAAAELDEYFNDLLSMPESASDKEKADAEKAAAEKAAAELDEYLNDLLSMPESASDKEKADAEKAAAAADPKRRLDGVLSQVPAASTTPAAPPPALLTGTQTTALSAYTSNVNKSLEAVRNIAPQSKHFLTEPIDNALAGKVDGKEFLKVDDQSGSRYKFKYKFKDYQGEEWYVAETPWTKNQYDENTYPHGPRTRALTIWKKGKEHINGELIKGAYSIDKQTGELSGGVNLLWSLKELASQAKSDHANQTQNLAKVRAIDLPRDQKIAYISIFAKPEAGKPLDPVVGGIIDDARDFPLLMRDRKYVFTSPEGKSDNFEPIPTDTPLSTLREQIKKVDKAIRHVYIDLNAHGDASGAHFGRRDDAVLTGKQLIEIINGNSDKSFTINSIACLGGGYRKEFEDAKLPNATVILQAKPDEHGMEGITSLEGQGSNDSSYFNLLRDEALAAMGTGKAFTLTDGITKLKIETFGDALAYANDQMGTVTFADAEIVHNDGLVSKGAVDAPPPKR